jgi:magnesium-dependent phosphatase 1
MILFDDEAINNTVEMMLGVTFQVSRDQKGLTWANYQEGLDIWRRTKAIHSPWHGLNLNSYPKRKLIRYSGMDIRTIQQLEAGGRRTDRKEAARWGFAVYVADDPRVAIWFNNWIKRFFPGTATVVCAIYARDGDIWDRMNKIWAPNSRTDIMLNTSSDFMLGWSEEDRNRQVAQWGVKKPYVLFSRHPSMGSDFPNHPRRFNELVIYPQVQENLLVIRQMSPSELGTASNIYYEGKVREWNITIPQETRNDFAAFGENIG